MAERRNSAGQIVRPRVDQGGPNMLQQGHAGEPGEAREVENRGNAAIRDIGMISWGPTDGDSGRARKSHERRLEILTVGCSREQAVIGNSRVARVFVDTGSSVNILFRSAFEEMQIDASEFQPVATSLYGFTAKTNNKWRVCIDFKDLNRASPKDCYPLPRIDQLVDSTAGCERICMLDAYQGYHQIPLAVEDQEKVSFITTDGTFCYTVMPFGLRNAGATYQRMMDKIFREQAGCNVEVYGDDILIKSPLVANLIDDVEETCGTLRQYGLKLNPFKYLFGAKGGKFLGYLVTERGIEANPEKWDEECTRAFKELKKYLETLPSLFKPVTREPLWVYLFVTPEVVGAGVESRYTTLEKLVYGLVLMARCLRPYFLAHPIMVLTNSTMDKALTNMEVAGRRIKWMTELGEYNITYQPCTAIKAQALADFLTELAVRLNFRATNNEAEYEALLARLQAARHVGASRVIIYSDSQLVTQQVTGNFEINSDKLQVYREAYEKMKEEFKEVTVIKIPRAENGRADELAKMASSLTTWVLDKSIAQTFLIIQIDLQNNRDEIIDQRAPMISYLQ
ncbi:uncharacterized protein LOC122022935 [Zingiber officinale]|uniref:uncharacterized protein LOC122022935 n=1 Tax=Zingiber officinale TaxID=94328 RepID=UPI001C4BAA12|nr:uncharacterized protein LOC122022935 [Zingiber officinale]